ncbi:transposable element Tcb2 transposase [Trichonephila clavipes]|nr:transposable element Tcb2 transposase [Trichonephila clavipes]
MPLPRFRRQYQQLPQFERGRINGIMEAGWSARRVARQLGLSHCVVRRCCNCFIGRHPDTGSIFTRATVSSRTIRRRLAEGHLGSRCPLRVLPLTPTHRRLRLEWCRPRGIQDQSQQ